MGKSFPQVVLAGMLLTSLLLIDSRSGVVQYRNFINRCALRLDAHQTHSTRRRDTLRRDQVRSWRVTDLWAVHDAHETAACRNTLPDNAEHQTQCPTTS